MNSSAYPAQEARARNLICLDRRRSREDSTVHRLLLVSKWRHCRTRLPRLNYSFTFNRIDAKSKLYIISCNKLFEAKTEDKNGHKTHTDLSQRYKGACWNVLTHTPVLFSVVHASMATAPCTPNVFFFIYNLSKSAPILKSDTHNPTVCELLAMSFKLASEQISELAFTFP